MLVERKTVVTNGTGLHARPAAMFVQKANQYQSSIKVVCRGKEVNAKSIIGVLSLGAGQGSELEIKAEGKDAEAAVHGLVGIVEEGFPEEDGEG